MLPLRKSASGWKTQYRPPARMSCATGPAPDRTAADSTAAAAGRLASIWGSIMGSTFQLDTLRFTGDILVTSMPPADRCAGGGLTWLKTRREQSRQSCMHVRPVFLASFRLRAGFRPGVGRGYLAQAASAVAGYGDVSGARSRASGHSEERRVGKECRSRWSPYH